MELADAIKLVAKLARTRNFPQSEDGVRDFAESLARISESLGIEAAGLVQRCADISEFCPTDADLWTVARELKEEKRRKEEAASPSQVAQWRKEYGPPQPFVTNEQPDWYARVKASNARRDELWHKLKDKFPGAGLKGHDWPDWFVLANAARELGYPEYAAAWEKSVKW